MLISSGNNKFVFMLKLNFTLLQMKESVKHFIKNEEKMTIYEQNEMISLV
jgi:hypothetical protein